MGGRGASSGGWAGGGGGGVNVGDTTSLISARERQQKEVDQTLTVLKDVYDTYGVQVMDAQIATLDGRSRGVMAYYDSNGNLAVNKDYFDAAKMDSAYDACVGSGFHPGRGNKTGLEAVVAHEMGHRLTHAAGASGGEPGNWDIDSTANSIVKAAARNAGYKDAASMAAKISGYAKSNAAEAIAEAYADVYCNGSRARKESRAIYNELDKRLKAR